MSFLNLATFRPSSPAYFSRSATASACWLANILSCISQALPCLLAARKALAAPRAWAWKDSGWFTNAMATSFGYLSVISFSVGFTREQNGHWKSLNSTMVTLACLGPLRGACAGMATFLAPPWGAAAGGVPAPFLGFSPSM